MDLGDCPKRSYQIGQAYLKVCENDVEAFKPGNVSVYSEGHDMTVSQFRQSAKSSEPFISNPDLSLGEKIYYAVQATRKSVGCNTNLGIILLCVPLIEAVSKRSGKGNLRSRLRKVLDNTTRQDANWVFKAIRMASPGGLGDSEQHDVKHTPSVNLVETMRFAADRDRIAWQYVNCYKDVFDCGIKRYHIALNRWGKPIWATVEVFVGLLRRNPDSHIVRKFGNEFTGMVNARMTLLDEELSKAERPEQLLPHLREVDAEFKSLGINPGTTADLTAASLLAVELEQLLGEDNQ